MTSKTIDRLYSRKDIYFWRSFLGWTEGDESIIKSALKKIVEHGGNLHFER
jgi:hypothetical protein